MSVVRDVPVLGLRLDLRSFCSGLRHVSFCPLALSWWVFCLGLFAVMDFLSVAGVDGSDSESSADEADVPPGRLYRAVAQHRLIPSFSGGCVATQLVGKSQEWGGMGRDRYLWARRWGTAL